MIAIIVILRRDSLTWLYRSLVNLPSLTKQTSPVASEENSKETERPCDERISSSALEEKNDSGHHTSAEVEGSLESNESKTSRHGLINEMIRL